jgi:hypothetical protein
LAIGPINGAGEISATAVAIVAIHIVSRTNHRKRVYSTVVLMYFYLLFNLKSEYKAYFIDLP